jgi:hypothetical protein
MLVTIGLVYMIMVILFGSLLVPFVILFGSLLVPFVILSALIVLLMLRDIVVTNTIVCHGIAQAQAVRGRVGAWPAGSYRWSRC